MDDSMMGDSSSASPVDSEDEDACEGNDLPMMSGFSVRELLCMWPVCQAVNRDSIPEAIRLAVVFGSGGDNVIFVTDDDEVFSFGSTNTCGIIGIQNSGNRTTPTGINNLHRRGVCHVAAGVSHVLALTADGEVFESPYPTQYELGNGNRLNRLGPQLCRGLQGHKVKQIACGCSHSLALTDAREVFGWGRNTHGQVGTGEDTQVSSPALLQDLSSSAPVDLIRCGGSTSFALTTDGEVYSWGANDCGQLGIGTRETQTRPQKVGAELDVKFQDMACGPSHSLALTDEGQVYAWGKNYSRQVGVGSSASIRTPKCVPLDGKRVKEVGAIILADFSAALTWCGSVIVWGDTKVGNVGRPKVTHFINLHEAFKNLCSPAVTHRPLTSDSQKDKSAKETLDAFVACTEAHFNNEEVSNVKFLVEERTLHGHISFLIMRSAFFKTLLGSEFQRGIRREVEVKGHSYAAFKCYLKYIYTGRLEINGNTALGVLQLASEYLDEDVTKECVNCVMCTINVQNALDIFATARAINVKELELKCIKFILKNFPAITKTEAYDRLDPQMAKHILCTTAAHTPFKD